MGIARKSSRHPLLGFRKSALQPRRRQPPRRTPAPRRLGRLGDIHPPDPRRTRSHTPGRQGTEDPATRVATENGDIPRQWCTSPADSRHRNRNTRTLATSGQRSTRALRTDLRTTRPKRPRPHSDGPPRCTARSPTRRPDRDHRPRRHPVGTRPNSPRRREAVHRTARTEQRRCARSGIPRRGNDAATPCGSAGRRTRGLHRPSWRHTLGHRRSRARRSFAFF